MVIFMNIKKRTLILTLSLFLLSGLCLGANAAGTLKTISAYLNYGITISYNGENQIMYDAAGTRVYPISYNGTTYVPIRAVSNMLGIDVEWDGTNNTVLLGATASERDFVNEFKPYSTSRYGYRVVQDIDHKSETIAGKTYSHWIELWSNGGGYYDLGGKYSTLNVQVYSQSDAELYFYGDNDRLLTSINIKGNSLPTSYSIDVSNVTQLLICGPKNNGVVGDNLSYIINATIK